MTEKMTVHTAADLEDLLAAAVEELASMERASISSKPTADLAAWAL
ncbi:hypothetical protein [Nonomuraea sp. 10N515B]